MRTIRAAVFSGGGVKGAFQLGAVKGAFRAHPDLAFDAVFGVSTGALNAALIAQGRNRTEQIERINTGLATYRRIRGNDDVVRGSRFLPIQVLNFLTRGYLYDPTPLKRLMHGAITSSGLKRGIHCGIGMVDLLSGKYLESNANDWRFGNPFDRILASCTMPGYMPPVDVRSSDGERWLLVDGGLRSITPLRDAVHWLKGHPATGARLELWVFLANPIDLARVREHLSGAQVVGRTLGIILNEVYKKDLEELVDRNLEWGRTGDTGSEPINASIVAPAVDYGSSLDFQPERIGQMIEDGLAAGARMTAPDLFPEVTIGGGDGSGA